MEQTYSSETDPPEIRRRLECIQGQRALIEDLATRLKVAQLECDRMETELKEYQASIAPIRKCPDEVLLMIFESFSQAAPELVAGLLQVCRRWRDIAANAPRLWTHIRIKIERTWDQRKAARKEGARIETYLQHSGSLPLHINLDLSDMLNEESQADGFLRGFLSNGCKNEICWDARKFVSKLDGDESEAVASFSESYGPEHVWRIVYGLVGCDRMHMGRWKSLRVFLPRNGRNVTEIWELLSGPTPQLTELLVSSNRLSQWSLVSNNDYPVSLPDLSSLEALTLQNGVVKDIDFLGLTFPSVKRLDLTMDISHYSQLSRFTSLEYLDVLFQGTSAADAEKAIHLPSLKDLAFHVYGSTGVEWHVPVLQTLKIVGSPDDDPEWKGLPNVQALKVYWTLGAWTGITTGMEPSLLRTLQDIISKYSNTQKLSIQVLLKPIWEKFVRDLSEEKRLVLPTVKFV